VQPCVCVRACVAKSVRCDVRHLTESYSPSPLVGCACGVGCALHVPVVVGTIDGVAMERPLIFCAKIAPFTVG
jgi:hypothetical protein